MFKKTITYEDFNGEQATEDFYFNLTKAELFEMELSGEDGSMAKTLESIAKSNDNKKILETFKWIILKAYGVKSEDGKRFIKNDDVRREFEESAAYSELYFELMTDADAAANFMNALAPKNLDDDLKKVENRNNELADKIAVSDNKSVDDVAGMSREELVKKFEEMNKGNND